MYYFQTYVGHLQKLIIILETEQVHTSEKDVGVVISLLDPLNKMMSFSCLSLSFLK